VPAPTDARFSPRLFKLKKGHTLLLCVCMCVRLIDTLGNLNAAALRVQSSPRHWTWLRNFRKLAQNPLTSEKGAHKHNNRLAQPALLGNFQSTDSGRRGRENCIKYVRPAQSHDDALLCRFIQSRRSSAWCMHAHYSHRVGMHFFVPTVRRWAERIAFDVPNTICNLHPRVKLIFLFHT
jgi:hypothetical protein